MPRMHMHCGTITALSVLVVAIAGCAGGTGHQKAKNSAEQRYRETRSGFMIQMAEQHFRSGDLNQAEQVLVEALQVDSLNPDLHILAGRIAFERGQLERAFGRFNTALEGDADRPVPHYYQGMVLQRWRKYDEAYEAYTRAYDLQPDNPHFLMAMVEMLVAQDRIDDGLALLVDKLTYFDQNAGLRLAAGQLYAMAGDDRNALRMLVDAQLLAPDDLQIQEMTALARLRNGQQREGLRELERLVAHPDLQDRVDLRRTLGRAYRTAQRFEDSKRIFLTLTRQDPKDADAWVELTQISWAMGDAAAALTAANRVIALAPDRLEGHLIAGLVWQQRGDSDRAIRHFDRAAQLSPDSPEPLILRGITLQQAGHRAAALASYSQALHRSPEDRRARRLFATLVNDKP